MVDDITFQCKDRISKLILTLLNQIHIDVRTNANVSKPKYMNENTKTKQRVGTLQMKFLLTKKKLRKWCNSMPQIVFEFSVKIFLLPSRPSPKRQFPETAIHRKIWNWSFTKASCSILTLSFRGIVAFARLSFLWTIGGLAFRRIDGKESGGRNDPLYARNCKQFLDSENQHCRLQKKRIGVW